MAAILTTFFQQKHDNYLALKQASQEELAKASAELKSALSNYDSLVRETASLEASIAAKRLEMTAANNLPSDIETLAGQLRQLLINRRHKAAELANKTEALRIAEANIAVEESNFAKLSKAFTKSETELTTAIKRKELHDNWVSSETEDAIAEVRNIATALLAENPVIVEEGETDPAEVLSAAKARIENDIPEVLTARARARAGLLATKVAKFQSYNNSIVNDLLNQGATVGGTSGVVAQRWAEYEVAEENLKNYVLTSINQYENALSMLISVVASKELTTSVSERIDETELAADAPAIKTEEALNAARAAVDAKLVDVKLAKIAALKTDVNADPDADSNVQTLQNELNTLEAELTTAKTAHTAELATAMDLWEVAVPDAIWANLRAFDSAISILTALSNSDGSVLAAALTAAETALVSALSNEDNNNKLRNILAAYEQRSAAQTDYLTSVQGSLTLGALRGDY